MDPEFKESLQESLRQAGKPCETELQIKESMSAMVAELSKLKGENKALETQVRELTGFKVEHEARLQALQETAKEDAQKRNGGEFKAGDLKAIEAGTTEVELKELIDQYGKEFEEKHPFHCVTCGKTEVSRQSSQTGENLQQINTGPAADGVDWDKEAALFMKPGGQNGK